MRERREEILMGLEEFFTSLLEDGFCGLIELQLQGGELVGLSIRERVDMSTQEIEDLIWKKTGGEYAQH